MSDFDWVTERANCSVQKVFRSLELGIKADVDKRNGARKPDDPTKWDTASNGNRFTAFREGGDEKWSPKVVEFTLVENEGISVAHDNVHLFHAAITITDDGKCRLRVNKKELEEWQVRRKALQELFFKG